MNDKIQIHRQGNFQVTFDNGIQVSIFIGGGSYSDNRTMPYGFDNKYTIACNNAEIAIFDANGKSITKEYDTEANTDVIGYKTPADILDILNWAAKHA